jgi:hypothetical protein
MKAIHTLLAASVLAAAMPSAFAASSVDLTVSGTIVPSACTPTLSAPNVNFGKISAADLLQEGPTAFLGGRLQSTLNVNCDAPTLYVLRGIDNRKATVGNDWYLTPYGLGMTAKGEKLGAHYLEIFPVRSTIDGKPAFVTVGNAAGTTWTASAPAEKGLRNYGELLGFTDTAGVTSGPIPIKDGTYGLQHYLVFAPASGLTLTDEVALDGSAVIEVVYL